MLLQSTSSPKAGAVTKRITHKWGLDLSADRIIGSVDRAAAEDTRPSALNDLSAEMGSPPNGVRRIQTIKGSDRDRSGDDSGLERRQNVNRKKAIQ